MVDGDLSTLEGITAATRGSACALGLAEEVGTIEPGKVADLVIVDGDPLVDVRIFTEPERIWLVFQGGPGLLPVGQWALSFSQS